MLLRSGDYRARLVRNLGANVFGQIIGAVIQVIGVPIFLHYWGGQLYGEWLLLSTIPSYFAMNDAGFASVGATEMTVLVARDDRAGAVRVFRSIWLLISVISLTLLCVLAVVVWFAPIDRWLSFAAIGHDQAALTIVLLLVQVAASQQMGILDAGFRCTGNYALGTTWVSAMRLSEFLLIACAVVGGGGPVAAAGMALLARVAGGGLMWGHFRRRNPWLSLGWRQASLGQIRRLAGPAFAFLAFPLGHALRNQGIITSIGFFLGPVAVVTFATARTMTNLVYQLMVVFNHAVWPEMSAAFGEGDLRRARGLHRQSCRASLWASGGAVAGLFLFGAWIYRGWTRGEATLDVPLFHVLLVILVANSLWYTSSIVPIAINRHQRTALCYLLGSGLALLLAILLLPRLGLVGAGVALLAIDAVMLCQVLPMSLVLLQDRFLDFARVVLRPPFAWRGGIRM
jgi:O-antigen/teichoic acid export membrane protein